jgi:hypothetical protein
MRKMYDHKVNWALVGEGLGLSIEGTIKFFDDGRTVSRYGEFVQKEREKGVRQNEKSPYDVKEINGVRSEVRAITKQISFAASKEVGIGRNVTEEGFVQKLNSLDRFIAIDKRKINDGTLSFIELKKEDLDNLKLGKNKSISSKKFFKTYDRNK